MLLLLGLCASSLSLVNCVVSCLIAFVRSAKCKSKKKYFGVCGRSTFTYTRPIFTPITTKELAISEKKKRKKSPLRWGGVRGLVLPGFGNLSEKNCSGWREEKNIYDVDLRLIFHDFTSFELRAVDRSVFYHLSPGPAAPPQSLSHNLRRHRSPSRHPARGYVSSFCVLRGEHLAIYYPSTCPSISPRLLLLASSRGARRLGQHTPNYTAPPRGGAGKKTKIPRFCFVYDLCDNGTEEAYLHIKANNVTSHSCEHASNGSARSCMIRRPLHSV